MSRDLNLTPAQRVGIDSIMQRTDSALRAVRAEAQPRLTRIFESSRAEISARLDSAQRVKFAQRQSRRRERR
jgi:Spy/CpxP family protein refolding chaperone